MVIRSVLENKYVSSYVIPDGRSRHKRNDDESDARGGYDVINDIIVNDVISKQARIKSAMIQGEEDRNRIHTYVLNYTKAERRKASIHIHLTYIVTSY